tara:strand:- start:4211 stop:5275 length:1065 start_codon:yes stop_codon:yes gene_type:complete
MNKSELIKGSSGCIFRPNIPCENSKKKRTKKKVSKLFIKKNKEYKIGLKVKKIKGYSKWTILWESICKSPEYIKLVENTGIKECLLSQNFKPDSIPSNYKFTLYQGEYGGETIDKYNKKFFKLKTFNSEKEFIKSFKKIFKLLDGVFYGLTQLNKHGICHHDINSRNILIKNNKSYIIDYDISLIMKKLDSNSFLINRMNEEFHNYRIYEIYPYEYIYYPLKDEEEILKEQENIELYQNRLNYYEIYEPIHVKLFKNNTDELRFENLEDKLLNINKPDLTDLISKIDVYSLGMTILILFIDRCGEHNININECIRLFRLKDLKPYMELIRDMVKYDYRDRIDIHTAYERYQNLI